MPGAHGVLAGAPAAYHAPEAPDPDRANGEDGDTFFPERDWDGSGGPVSAQNLYCLQFVEKLLNLRVVAVH
jgi:hypothetical protein